MGLICSLYITFEFNCKMDRTKLRFSALNERKNRVNVESDLIFPENEPREVNGRVGAVIDKCAERIQQALPENRPVIMAFGAHSIKNGLGPVLIRLMNEGFVTHLATNGAGVIHDWELAWLGETSEYVEANLKQGRFGGWEETGYYINLAIITGVYERMGYGESVGAMINRGYVDIPSAQQLRDHLAETSARTPVSSNLGAAADLLHAIDAGLITEGRVEVDHKFREHSPQAAAWRLGVPFTAHPMFGHDIIYLHPLNQGSAIGRAAQTDFLRFADSVSEIENGVYLSIGSAVMSPMIFEKSMSMAQNLALQKGARIENHFITVVDLQESSWDWSTGEPPEDHPDYYLRYCKTFSRMGGEMHYACADNRDFLLHLYRRLTLT